LNTHVPSSSFGGTGAGAGELSSPDGIAIDSTTHDLYVADRGNLRIDEFSKAGAFIRAWGWGVADGLPAFETCTLVCERGLSGSGAGQFTTPSFIAVDNSAGPSAGDVYVGDTGDQEVSKFTAEGALVESWGVKGQLDGSTATGGPFGSIAGIALDAGGTLLVINEGSHLFEFAQDGTFSEGFEVARGTAANGLAVDAEGSFFKTNGSPSVEEITNTDTDVGQVNRSESAAGLAVETSTGALYADEGSHVEAFTFTSPGVVSEAGGATCAVEPDIGCTATDSFGEGTLSAGTGIAVDASDGEVYVADASTGNVDTFVPGIIPDVETGDASEVTNTTAKLHGTVNPDGTATSYQFQYGTSTEYGSVSPASPASVGSDSTTHTLTANLSALSPSTTYHYRIIASNAQGTNRGADATFRTTGPPTIEAQEAEGVGQTEASIRSEVNPNGFDTDVHVEYGPTTSYGASTAALSIGSGATPQSATQRITGLQISTTYHYRVVASNSQGVPVDGPDETFTTSPPARIEGESFSHVGSTSATLSARIDDFGTLTSYQIEYGPSTAYGSSTPAVSIGSSSEPVAVSVPLSGLQPSTKYHFRFVTTNAFGVETGPDVTFTTAGAAGASASSLPDGRVYELVSTTSGPGEAYAPGSPEYLEQDSYTEQLFEAAASGDAVVYMADPAVIGGNGDTGAGEGNDWLATRTAQGWQTSDISPVGSHAGEIYEGFSSDLSVGILEDDQQPPLSPDAPPGCQVLYARDSASGAYRALFTTSKVPRECGKPHFAGESADGSQIIFQDEAALTENALETEQPVGESIEGHSNTGSEAGEACEFSCDLYDSVAGQLRLVNVLPGGEADPDATFGGAADLHKNGPELSNAISSDGSRIFWTDTQPGSKLNHIYVLENGTTNVQVSGEGSAKYWTATPDGRYAFYTEGESLWRFDTEHGTREELIGEGMGGESAGVQGVMGINDSGEDGSYIYFVATGVLASNENTNGEKPEAAADNLYLSHAGATIFITTLSSDDDELEGVRAFLNERFGDWVPGLGNRTAKVTGDGRHLVFESIRSLTGYDNIDTATGQPLVEAYTYSADTGRLACASCNPTGEAPSVQIESRNTLLPISNSDTDVRRWISEDGSRVFFDTVQPLVAQDTNGAQDVYEWEREGTPSCPEVTPARRDAGCVFLLSGGESSDYSYLVDASANGDDVFFTDRLQLVPQDEDEKTDLYDARVDGYTPPVASACTGTGCQGVPPAPPSYATPASATFNGIGNFAPQPPVIVKPKSKPQACRKGWARKRGKCVRKTKKTKRRAGQAGKHATKGKR
jgi:hypothetical protein